MCSKLYIFLIKLLPNKCRFFLQYWPGKQNTHLLCFVNKRNKASLMSSKVKDSHVSSPILVDVLDIAQHSNLSHFCCYALLALFTKTNVVCYIFNASLLIEFFLRPTILFLKKLPNVFFLQQWHVNFHAVMRTCIIKILNYQSDVNPEIE